MAMHAISVKELRQKFPFVQSELKKGESFLLIAKSKPIAEIYPVDGNATKLLNKIEEEDLKAFSNAALADLDRELGDDYLSEEEIKYYKSLPRLV